jgi:cytochrome c biogenesis protein CcmG, thiol:disulfide interchange protein DsbE
LNFLDRSQAKERRRAAAAAVLAATALALGGCGADDSPPAAKSTPGSPSGLAGQASQILGGGRKAFEHQLAALRGHPVVVNKWASWCGPCRYEFPFFARLAEKQGGTIAFLGVDSRDSRTAAEKFLAEFPVPYPSFYDRDGALARLFRGDRAFPTTAFYDSDGKLVFTKQGGYASEAAISKDIAQYAK